MAGGPHGNSGGIVDINGTWYLAVKKITPDCFAEPGLNFI